MGRPAPAPHFWAVNHGVAESNEDMQALLTGSADGLRRRLSGAGVVPASDAADKLLPMVSRGGPASDQTDDVDGEGGVSGAVRLLLVPFGHVLTRLLNAQAAGVGPRFSGSFCKISL